MTALNHNACDALGPDTDDSLLLIPNNPGQNMVMPFWIVACEAGSASITFAEHLKQSKTITFTIHEDE